MPNSVIKVENITKIYRIGLKEEIHSTFAESIFNFIKSPLKNYRQYRSLYTFDDLKPGQDGNHIPSDILWALTDISFEVQKGEILGFIGRNGAGKSTLLKILSRITFPTFGRAEIIGTVSSLLEVGTGFHPELTGRENVYLNGTILGMRKKEIDLIFDEIVEFSGVEKFINTPVKRYSSGMKVRLAFAVAAHLEPEILIIDEVLAVGDLEFQKKCIAKMNRVAKEGRTVIFVSHNMSAVTELCSRAIWLDGGLAQMDGPSLDVVSQYISSGGEGAGMWTTSRTDEGSGRRAMLKHARVLSGTGDAVSMLARYDERVKIEIKYEIKNAVQGFRSYILLRDAGGNIIWSSHDTDGNSSADHVRQPGIYISTCTFPDRMLKPGLYYVTIGIFGKPREAVEEEIVDALCFQISGEDYIFNHDKRRGIITPFIAWQIEQQQESNGIPA